MRCECHRFLARRQGRSIPKAGLACQRQRRPKSCATATQRDGAACGGRSLSRDCKTNVKIPLLDIIAQMDPDIRQAIEEARKGDPEAFEMLIRTYSRRVFAHAYSILHHCQEAEDIVQETFLKAYKTLSRLREPEKFPSWLFAIARNRALDLLRQRKLDPLPENIGEISTEDLEKPAHSLENTELHEKVRQVVSSLPENHRLAITLRYLEGMDYQTIQETMGLTNGALRGVLGRALGTLRKSLKPAMDLS